jgi:hypothetical protein
MSLLYAVDPGTLQSALVICRRGAPFGLEVVSARMLLNGPLLAELARVTQPADLVIERIEAMGLPIGNETIDTILWSGRFYEAWPGASTRHWVTRRQVKLGLCGSMQAKDPHVRQMVMDRFGGLNAKGTKSHPGPLYGLHSHLFAALAVAVVWCDQHAQASTSQGFGPLSAGSDALLR